MLMYRECSLLGLLTIVTVYPHISFDAFAEFWVVIQEATLENKNVTRYIFFKVAERFDQLITG